jgi:integrase
MLTEREIKTAKASGKARKLFDERGLYLLVTPAGGKLWRFKYRFGGKEKLLALGAYPDVPLADARNKRDDARKLIAVGIDPAARRRAERTASSDTFESVAREWFEAKSKEWVESHARTVLQRLEQHLFPFIGNQPARDIAAPELLTVLQRVEKRGAHETARRVRQIASDVFERAIVSGKADRNPAADLRKALVKPKVRHHAAYTDPKDVAGLLRIIDAYQGSNIIVKSALQLAPLVFVRPGELRKAEWAEFDLDAARWLIPPWRMKMRQALLVPLSRQAVAVLRQLQPVTGHGRFVFPSARSEQRPMSDNAVLAALRRCGVPADEQSGHGFRALARTILDEVLGVRVDLIDHQLGHTVRDPNGRAYNRTTFLPERVKMMQQWADYLDELKSRGPAMAAATAGTRN